MGTSQTEDSVDLHEGIRSRRANYLSCDHIGYALPTHASSRLMSMLKYRAADPDLEFNWHVGG